MALNLGIGDLSKAGLLKLAIKLIQRVDHLTMEALGEVMPEEMLDSESYKARKKYIEPALTYTTKSAWKTFKTIGDNGDELDEQIAQYTKHLENANDYLKEHPPAPVADEQSDGDDEDETDTEEPTSSRSLKTVVLEDVMPMIRVANATAHEFKSILDPIRQEAKLHENSLAQKQIKNVTSTIDLLQGEAVKLLQKRLQTDSSSGYDARSIIDGDKVSEEELSGLLGLLSQLREIISNESAVTSKIIASETKVSHERPEAKEARNERDKRHRESSRAELEITRNKALISGDIHFTKGSSKEESPCPFGFGEDGAHRVLFGQNATMKAGEYTYYLKWQATIFQDETMVGIFEGCNEDGTECYFKNGQKCWNGPKRSMTVRLRCSDGRSSSRQYIDEVDANPRDLADLSYSEKEELKEKVSSLNRDHDTNFVSSSPGILDLVDIREPSMCVYTADVNTPLACTNDDLLALKEELEGFTTTVEYAVPNDHDEL